MKHKHVDTIVGALTLEEAASLSQLNTLPIISLSPPQESAAAPSYFIQMSNPVAYQMQCIAAIVGHFRWRKVILMHEQGSQHSGSALFTSLSSALRAVDSSVDLHVTVPRVTSLAHPTTFIQRELKKLRNNNVKTFVVVQSSLQFAVILFEKAKVLGMMEKGYVWIVSDEIANLLDSVDPSVIRSMQGVVGLKTDYSENSERFRAFNSKFRRKYSSTYPIEEENPTPSIYSVRAYDAIFAVVNSLHNSKTKIDLDGTQFEGLSGKISFNNALLSQKPIFHVVNVIGKSYREVAVWSTETSLTGELSSIHWPGGEQSVPKGWSVGSRQKPLKIGVPARGAFNQFVKVTLTHDWGQNKTQITGFSIEVFEAAVRKLPYDLYYEFVPYYGSYDEMVAEVHNKVYI